VLVSWALLLKMIYFMEERKMELKNYFAGQELDKIKK